MERFDIIDEEGQPTGEVTEREKAHAEGIRHRTAHIWLVREADGRREILLQKRAMNKDSFPGCFDTSSAGHIQAGDEPLRAALREFKDNEIAFVFVYRKPVDIRRLTLQTEEVEKVEWFDLEETYQECLRHNPKFCVPIGGLETIRSYLMI